MRKVIIAYSLWFAFVATASIVALAWYRYVEEIRWEEVGRRLKEQQTPDSEPEEVV